MNGRGREERNESKSNATTERRKTIEKEVRKKKRRAKRSKFLGGTKKKETHKWYLQENKAKEAQEGPTPFLLRLALDVGQASAESVRLFLLCLQLEICAILIFCVN